MKDKTLVVEVKDMNMPELAIYTKYKDAQLMHYREPEPGIFIVESSNVILRALKAGYRPISLLVEKQKWSEAGQNCRSDEGRNTAKINTRKEDPGAYDVRETNIRKISGSSGGENSIPKEIPNSGNIEDVKKYCGDIPVYLADTGLLQSMVGYHLTGGILCAMERRKMPLLEEICRDSRRIVVLERVMNPINVGSIFRSAAALGVDAVLLTAGCTDPLYRRASRVSMGTVFQVPWTYIDLPESPNPGVRPSAEYPGNYVKRLKKMGFAAAALALRENSVTIEDEQLLSEEKLALLMGTEGDGLYPETIQDCDYTVMIPMAHGVDSLNVAAASAIAIWQVTRK